MRDEEEFLQVLQSSSDRCELKPVGFSAPDRPNQGVAANNLAWIYAEQGRGREALRLAQTAHRVLGDQPSVIDTLGWIYHLQDSSKAAVALLTKAAEANPSNPVYRYHLGAALMKMNESDHGRRELQRALTSSSTFDGAADARRLLAEQSR